MGLGIRGGKCQRREGRGEKNVEMRELGQSSILEGKKYGKGKGRRTEGNREKEKSWDEAQG